MIITTIITRAEYGMDRNFPYKVGLKLEFNNGYKTTFYGKVYYQSSQDEKNKFYETSKEIVFLLKDANVINISYLIGKEVKLYFSDTDQSLRDIKFN